MPLKLMGRIEHITAGFDVNGNQSKSKRLLTMTNFKSFFTYIMNLPPQIGRPKDSQWEVSATRVRS